MTASLNSEFTGSYKKKVYVDKLETKCSLLIVRRQLLIFVYFRLQTVL